MAWTSNTYYVWRRSDGCVSVSVQSTHTNSSGVPNVSGGPPADSERWTYEILLETTDFTGVRELVAKEKAKARAAGAPFYSSMRKANLGGSNV